MSTIPVKDMQGASVGDYNIDDALLTFDKGAQAMHEAVKTYLANQRQGSASTLEKGEVAGTGAKPWKQKGLGRARAGYKQSPVWRGGGTVFGPRPRSYRKTMTKKALKLAFRRALSEKIAGGAVTVLDSLTLDGPKTKQVATLIKNLQVGRTVLLVVDQPSNDLFLAARNIPNLEVEAAQNINVYQVLRYAAVVISREGMAVIEARLQAPVERGA